MQHINQMILVSSMPGPQEVIFFADPQPAANSIGLHMHHIFLNNS